MTRLTILVVLACMWLLVAGFATNNDDRKSSLSLPCRQNFGTPCTPEEQQSSYLSPTLQQGFTIHMNYKIMRMMSHFEFHQVRSLVIFIIKYSFAP